MLLRDGSGFLPSGLGAVISWDPQSLLLKPEGQDH